MGSSSSAAATSLTPAEVYDEGGGLEKGVAGSPLVDAWWFG